MFFLGNSPTVAQRILIKFGKVFYLATAQPVTSIPLIPFPLRLAWLCWMVGRRRKGKGARASPAYDGSRGRSHHRPGETLPLNPFLLRLRNSRVSQDKGRRRKGEGIEV